MNFKQIFYYYWQTIKQDKLSFFTVPFLYTIRNVLSGLLVGYLYKHIIDSLVNSSEYFNGYEVAIYYLIPFGIILIISPLIYRYGDFIYFNFLKKAVQKNYRFSFERLQSHSYSFFTNNFAGSLVTKVKKYNNVFIKMLDIVFLNFLPVIVAVFGSSIVLLFQSKKLAIYFLIWSLVYSFFVLFFVKKKIKIDIARSLADSKLTGVLSDSISNVLNIKIFSAFKKEKSSLDLVVSDFTGKMYKAWIFSLLRSLFQATFMVVFHIFILYTMINLWNDGEITIGVFVMAYSYIVILFDRIWDLSSSITNFMEHVTDAKEMVDIFDKNIDIKDPESPEELRIKDGEIEFKNVSFEYTEENEVFHNFNLKLKAGERVGLIGHSGSGKSTITKMLLRFVDIKEGEILIDGQNIKNITQDDLRSQISYVPQDPILFHRSIEENIGYSKKDASKEEVIEAAKNAHAHAFINSLPNGYDTFVGERGVKLSGGERQRVAIARAMLKDSPVLVLDEATSSLDSISESYIQDSLERLMEGKTTIVIAHRLSTILKMDRILVLDGGKIVEEGTHKELLERGRMYAEFWNHQTNGFFDK